MPSLAEAYDRHDGEVSRERLYLGTGLFGFGALLAVVGIVFATTGILRPVGFNTGQTLELAGTLVGLGIPAVFVGTFAVLPAGRSQQAAAAIGASLAVFGVMLFRYTYWERWYDAAGTPTFLTLLVAVVYFLGAIITFWSMFTAVATFKRRNDPGGTVELTISRGGQTRTVEVAESSLEEAKAALGSVGVFGGVDDPEQERKHHAEVSSDAGSTLGGTGPSSTGSTGGDPDGVDDGYDASYVDASPSRSRGGGGGPLGAGGPTPSSDGGAADAELSSPLDDDGEVLRDPTPAPATDRYCGNCAHFEYVQTADGIRPYCGHHDGLMDDMEACGAWEPNR